MKQKILRLRFRSELEQLGCGAQFFWWDPHELNSLLLPNADTFAEISIVF